MSLQAVFRRRVSYVCAIAIGGLCGVSARAQSVADEISQEVRSVFDRSKNAVVKIEAVDDNCRLIGTGFFIDPSGTIFTSYTIGGESNSIVVSRGEMRWAAKRVFSNSHSGIAILKVESPTPLPFLPLGKSQGLAIASPVMAIGYPMDLPVTPNFGTVGGFDIKYLDCYFPTTHIRANMPIQRGEGGAPLLNMSGEVIGILISWIDKGSGCFALPIEAAEKVRSDFMRFGEARPGWLGIRVDVAPHPADGSFAQVESLVAGAPAEKFGVHKGDILLEVGGRKITSREDMLDASFYLTAGDEIPLTVSRNGEKVSLKVQAIEHPGIPHRIAPSSPEQAEIPLKAER